MTRRNPSLQKRSLLFFGSALACVAFLAILGSCSSDSQVAVDSGEVDTAAPQPDTAAPIPDIGTIPDIGQPADQYVWPDTSIPADTWPHPSDSYAATPFGCTTDADCFGHKCCPTPWGVKLCSPTCS